MQILNALGVDWRILIAQLVNFFLLLFILKKILYKPMISFLEDRENKIKKGLENAEKYEKNLIALDIDREKMFKETQKDAQKFINHAVQEGQVIKDEIITNARDESKKILAKTKLQVEEQKDQMIDEVKNDLVDLISLSLERVANKKADKNDKEYIEDLLKVGLKS
jgi:F-type H+-transporting ATPase subunit b